MLRSNSSPICSQPELTQVTVYLRLSSKKGVKLILPNIIKLQQIAEIAQSQLNIPIPNQTIYHCSNKYSPIQDKILHLLEGTIFHIHDRTASQERIRINVQEIKPRDQPVRSTPYFIYNSTRIQDFIELHLERESALLIESGRWLDNNKSFKDENVENQATIYSINKGKQLNHDEFEKDVNSLFDDQESQAQPEESPISRITEGQRRLVESVEQRVSHQETNDCEPKLDFKKNKKPIYLKAVKTNPEDALYTWKLDKSLTDNQGTIKQARKVLKGKRKTMNSDSCRLENQSIATATGARSSKGVAEKQGKADRGFSVDKINEMHLY